MQDRLADLLSLPSNFTHFTCIQRPGELTARLDLERVRLRRARCRARGMAEVRKQ